MWNVYRAVINNGPRTNNFAEGHNHALQLVAGCSHPGIGLIIDILTLYNTDAELNIQLALSGTVLVPRRKKDMPNLTKRVSMLWGITEELTLRCTLEHWAT